ncbi:hypothetical protein SLA2020_228750 [Shorea laevis]
MSDNHNYICQSEPYIATFESVSKTSLLKPLLKAIDNPSQIARSSAAKLVVCPTYRENPRTYLPRSSLHTPPAPARPGLPSAQPSVFGLMKPVGGVVNHIITTYGTLEICVGRSKYPCTRSS